MRVDDGPWEPATLGPEAGIHYWRQWFHRWTPTPGEHELAVRATDGNGAVQQNGSDPPFPKGATGWHRITARAES